MMAMMMIMVRYNGFTSGMIVCFAVFVSDADFFSAVPEERRGWEVS
jgi:hypothetical protein